MTDKNFANGVNTMNFVDQEGLSGGITNRTTITIHDWENVPSLKKTSIIAIAAAEGFNAVD